MTQQLQSLLTSADPIRIDVDRELGEIVRRTSAAAQEEALTEPSPRTPWWKRRRTAIPLAVVGLVALTGAAVAIPLSLAINGALVGLDAEIPITYTTDNGIDISCRYGIYFGDPPAEPQPTSGSASSWRTTTGRESVSASTTKQ